MLRTDAKPTQLIAALLCCFAWGLAQAAAQHLDDNHVVRVKVTDADGRGQSATGFLWRSDRQVATSLHAVMHMRLPGRTLEVQCGGVPYAATVHKVLKRADLVLLTTDRAVEGCRVFPEAAAGRPVHRDPLYTMGWKGSAATVTYRDLKKGRTGDPETLRGLVTNQATLQALQALQMPALNLEVYFVTGDSLGGGYSGAPVVDAQGALVGIVDGGLDQGATDYNWLVPSAYLAELEAQGEPALPDIDLSLLTAHFSAGLVEPSSVQTEVAYAPKPSSGGADGAYNFVKTKTRSLAAIMNTADWSIAEGIEQLLFRFEPAIGPDAAFELHFDIFEDVERGLIIAVPEGQPLVDGPLPENPDVHQLRTEAEGPGDGYIQFREISSDAEGYIEVAESDDGTYYFPEEDGYLLAFVEQALRECAGWGDACELDEDSIYAIDLGGGAKVLSFGIWAEPQDDAVPYYEYSSVAVRGNAAFTAWAQVHMWEGDEGLFQCVDGSCSDRTLALTHLAQLVTAHLTTFASDLD